MYPKEARKEIEETILEFESSLTKTYLENTEIDFKNWIEEYHSYICSLFNGFKTLCFDNGDMVYYSKSIKNLEDLWERTKNKLLTMMGD